MSQAFAPDVRNADQAKGKLLAGFFACSKPRGTHVCKTDDLVAALSLDKAAPPPGRGDGTTRRDDFLAWLLGKPLGQELFGAALKIRTAALRGAAEPTAAAGAGQLGKVWPEGRLVQRPVDCSEEEEALWQQCLVAFGACLPAATCAANHFDLVVRAGLDANQVPFPPHPCRLPKPIPDLTPVSELERYDANASPFALPKGTAPEELRKEVHAEAAALDMELTPWPMKPADVIKQDERAEPQTATAARGFARRWRFEKEQSTADPAFFVEHKWLRAGMHLDEEALETAPTPWPSLEDDAIQNDRCLPAQEQLRASRAQRGPLSPEVARRRRAALWKRLSGGKEGPQGALQPSFFEEVQPVLEKEAALAEMRARWARDKAQEARERDERAAAGAEAVTWPIEHERRWPKPPAAWTQRCRWIAMWRASRRVAQAEARRVRQDCVRSLARSASAASCASSASGWELLSECSDSSWQQLPQPEAPKLELTTAADVADMEAELSKLREDYQEALERAQAAELGDKGRDSLDCLSKSLVVELKALSSPPAAVLLVSEALCLCLGVRPARVGCPPRSDYWKAAKAHVWGDPKLLLRLSRFDSEALASAPDRLEKLLPLVGDPQFQPAMVKRTSVAAGGLCQWVHGVVARAQVARKVAPKREALRRAEAGLAAARAALEERSSPAPEAAAAKLEVLSDATASLKALDCIAKADISELKALAKPPEAVIKTMGAVMTLMGQREPSWAKAQAMLGDVRFLERLCSFSHLEVSPAALRAVEKYTQDPDFTPDVAKKASSACAGLCQWVRAMKLLAEEAKAKEKASASADRAALSTPRTTAPSSPQKAGFSPASAPSMPTTPAAATTCPVEAVLDSVRPSSVSELKSFGKPPAQIKSLLTALMGLQAGINPDIAIDDQGDVKDPSWKAAQKLMGNPKKFLASLRAVKACIDGGSMPARNIQGARDVQKEGGFDQEALAKVSRCAADLGRWAAEAVAHYDAAAGAAAE